MSVVGLICFKTKGSHLGTVGCETVNGYPKDKLTDILVQ